MAKTENKLARQAYKRAIVDLTQALAALDTCGDVGVTFWAEEIGKVVNRHMVKLASVELPAVKKARHAADDTALAIVTAERDALAKRLASLGRGERAKVREARQEAGEAWDRLATATVYAGDDSNPDPEEPDTLPATGCDGCEHAWGCDARHGSALEDNGANCGWFEPASDDCGVHHAN